MPCAGYDIWRLRDEERVMRAIKDERAFASYVACLLRRQLDFDGNPTTPAWQDDVLARVRVTRRERVPV
jgi:hypothetical protein